MARKQKKIEEVLLSGDKKSIDRRDLGYYSTPEFISKYISKRMMDINNKGKKVLDPCCGKEELLNTFLENGLEIKGIDIIKHKDEYRCDFEVNDFLKYYCKRKDNYNNKSNFEEFNKSNYLELDYDYYIANPPYNCHEVDFIKNNKNKLKKYFNDVGVHNMYSMFISAIIDLAKEDAVIGLITHDSFLTAKHHEGLRRKILDKCAIHEITMCPTNLFLNQGADVRTSIIILQKGNHNQKKVLVNNRPLNNDELNKILNKNILGEYNKKSKLEDIILHSKKDNLEFIIECPDDIKNLFNGERLGEKFKCVTGISTGKDKLYLSDKKEDPFIIPFYKNPGKDRFYTDKYIYLHKDFLRFNNEINNFIVRNKSLLYKPGITCSSMGVEFTASILPENSTFGVNPNIICNESDLWWLLAYLNSTLVTYIVRGILIRSNMITSGYVCKIPLIDIDKEEKDKLSKLSKEAYEAVIKKEKINDIMEDINEIINKSAKISQITINLINKFKVNLVKNT